LERYVPDIGYTFETDIQGVVILMCTVFLMQVSEFIVGKIRLGENFCEKNELLGLE
jgi:hypothetical protein